MAYQPPVAGDLKARFPEFSTVPDSLINLILNEAIDQVGPLWIERDRLPATLHLAAHMLAMEGEPGRSNGDGSGGSTAVTGPVRSRTVGDVSTTFAGLSSGGGTSGAGSLSNYSLTVYGQRYLELLRKNFPAVAVV